MSAFTGPLTIREHDVDTDIWEMVSPLVWEIGHLGSGVFVTAESGFVSDGASIPFPVNIVFPRWGRKYRRPAVIHDHLCRLISAGTPDPAAPRRKDADRVFLEAMRACGVFLPVRYAFWGAVRVYAVVRGL
jgi:hypothetical protein